MQTLRAALEDNFLVGFVHGQGREHGAAGDEDVAPDGPLPAAELGGEAAD